MLPAGYKLGIIYSKIIVGCGKVEFKLGICYNIKSRSQDLFGGLMSEGNSKGGKCGVSHWTARALLTLGLPVVSRETVFLLVPNFTRHKSKRHAFNDALRRLEESKWIQRDGQFIRVLSLEGLQEWASSSEADPGVGLNVSAAAAYVLSRTVDMRTIAPKGDQRLAVLEQELRVFAKLTEPSRRVSGHLR